MYFLLIPLNLNSIRSQRTRELLWHSCQNEFWKIFLVVMIKFLNTSFTTTQHNFRWAEDFFQFAKRFFRNNFFPQNNSGMLMTPRLGFQRKTLLFPPQIMVGIWLVSRPCRESMKFWRETWPHWKRRYGN